ncbi:hypothetical protein fugu_008701 [Takifugu bimaculatus]|uniref:Uncharacterized protein n=1 Tax=Takifugu bimaculatus TaxID=433685 RepID=A0A4Z2AWH6_9TELE|nr:hypothetical protein fugu_008701 [Takifugu bimaculatus]
MLQRLILKVLPGIALIAPPCLAGTNILVTAAEVWGAEKGRDENRKRIESKSRPFPASNTKAPDGTSGNSRRHRGDGAVTAGSRQTRRQGSEFLLSLKVPTPPPRLKYGQIRWNWVCFCSVTG